MERSSSRRAVPYWFLPRIATTRADERPDEETTALPERPSQSTRTLAVTARQWDH